jgi:hypothetical protein
LGRFPWASAMLIYHSSPIRSFPLLVDIMAPLFSNPYHFRYPIKARTDEDHRTGILQSVIAYDVAVKRLPRRSVPGNGFPANILRNGISYVADHDLQPIDFVYGVFDGSMIIKQPEDFVFTIVSHPVKHVYDVFAYLAFLNRSTRGMARQIEGVLFFEDIVSAGLQRFVDRVIEGDRTITIAGVDFDMIRELCWFNTSVAYDLVGVEGHLPSFLEELSDRIGKPVVATRRLLSSVSELQTDNSYRYEDLCGCFADDIVFYAALKRRFE